MVSRGGRCSGLLGVGFGVACALGAGACVAGAPVENDDMAGRLQLTTMPTAEPVRVARRRQKAEAHWMASR